MCTPPISFFFFFNDTATTEIYTLSLHDALPIFPDQLAVQFPRRIPEGMERPYFLMGTETDADRKSTRLNSSHSQISYAVFCLKKKKKKHLRANGMRRLCTLTLRRE